MSAPKRKRRLYLKVEDAVLAELEGAARARQVLHRARTVARSIREQVLQAIKKGGERLRSQSAEESSAGSSSRPKSRLL
jgi:hypothetical protein